MQRCGLMICLVACANESAGIDGSTTGDGQRPRDAALIDGPSPDVPGGVGEPANLTGITLYHNQVRAMVQTAVPLPALAWDSDLAATAAAWVALCRDVQAPRGLIDHDPDRSVGHPYYVGENVFGSSGGATAQQAVNLWAAERASYDYATNTCASGKTCGHYTQIVWRTTLKVGCALGNCPGLTYGSTLVCDYGPGGNDGSRPY